ncbi:MAG: hypothetical protein AABX73_01675, partial [Nanoarchaeota archaeon]
LNPNPSTTDVIFTFIAKDRNKADDLVDSTASASFTSLGEPTRTGACSFLSQSGSQQKTYQCTVTMSHYDKAGLWTVSVSVQDSSGTQASLSSTLTLNLLRDISINPTTLNFPTVVQGDIDILSSANTQITNNGNFVVPTNGNLEIVASNLVGETNNLENIPASNIKASGLSGAANVCSTGSTLSHGLAVPITNANLQRGTSGSNIEDITYCLTLVPTSISTQFYSATGGNAWTIRI